MISSRIGSPGRTDRRTGWSRRDAQRHAQVAAFEAWQRRPAALAPTYAPRRAKNRAGVEVAKA